MTIYKGRLSHIVVAAGTGSRFGSVLPKQFCDLGGIPVVMHAINALRRATPEAEVLLVISQEMEATWRRLCDKHRFQSPAIIYGGSTRWESVRNGLAAVGSDVTAVSIHDGARPLISADVLHRALDALDAGAHGAVPVVPVTDSLRHLVSDDPAHGTAVDRSLYVAVQTPQIFNRKLLDHAYAMPYRSGFTDDASVMEAAGYTDLRLTEGSSYNIKITNPFDLVVAEALMRQTER